MQQEQFVYSANVEIQQYVGPYRLEKTLGKGQTGKYCVLLLLTGYYNFFFFYESQEFSKYRQLIEYGTRPVVVNTYDLNHFISYFCIAFYF